MLLIGAAVVRFANKFLHRFKREFVLFALCIRDDGEVSRYSLFQERNAKSVCWTSYIPEPAG